jgi:class 3 adenylate cyclase
MATAAAPPASPSLYGSVVFLKLQDFARRSATEQTRLRAQLEAVAAVVLAEIDPAGRVVLEAADGAAIAVLDDARGALRLAERAMNAVAAKLPLSAGLNHGALQLGRGRKRSDEGLVGDGIAVAAALAQHAQAGKLLASRAFREALAASAPGAEAALVPAGSFTDAGLRTHEIYRPDAAAARRRARNYIVASVAAAVLLVGAGIGRRVALEGEEQFMERMAAKAKNAVARVEYALRGWTGR